MKKELKKFPHCNALDEDGKRCRKHSAIETHYFGASEHYRQTGGRGIEVHWVKINVCIEHAMGIGYDFLKKKS